MPIQNEVVKFAVESAAGRGVRRIAGRAERKVSEKAGQMARDAIRLSHLGVRAGEGDAMVLSERMTLDLLAPKFGLTFDEATTQMLVYKRAGRLLEVLDGFKVDARRLKTLAAEVEGEVEVSRIRAIADFVRERPWMNPDLLTLDGFRKALPKGGNPAAAELEKALHGVDFRFNRDYKLVKDWIDDAHTWEFVSHNGAAGDEGASYWIRRGDGQTFLAKLPPDPRRAVNERVGYGIHTALGVPTNEVQYGQRDFVPLLSFHRRIEGEPVALDRVMHDIGLDRADYRLGPWPYPAENIGTGPSTWGRQGAEAYQKGIAAKLEDPAVFDKLHFIGRIDDDPDLKPGNILASVIKNADGSDVYRISRIDFGIMHDGWQLRNLQDDLAIFGRYLESLEEPVNRTHLGNILATARQFASMGDEQLTSELLGNVWRNSDGSKAMHLPADYQWQMTRRFLVKRDMVRAWLQDKAAWLASIGI